MSDELITIQSQPPGLEISFYPDGELCILAPSGDSTPDEYICSKTETQRLFNGMCATFSHAPNNIEDNALFMLHVDQVPLYSSQCPLPVSLVAQSLDIVEISFTNNFEALTQALKLQSGLDARHGSNKYTVEIKKMKIKLD